MKKMIKTAILTTSILASASIFAQNVGVNANGSAQVNVQSGGLISGVAGAVKNTAQGVGHAAHHVGHAAVNTGVQATQKRWLKQAMWVRRWWIKPRKWLKMVRIMR